MSGLFWAIIGILAILVGRVGEASKRVRYVGKQSEQANVPLNNGAFAGRRIRPDARCRRAMSAIYEIGRIAVRRMLRFD